MTLTLTKSEMLALWRRVHGLDPLRADCTVEAVDGIDIDAWLEPKMRRWYLRQLDTASPALLPVRELARSCSVAATSSALSPVTLPDGVRRVISVKLQGWKRPVEPLAWVDAAPRLARLASPFCQPGPCEPMAVIRADGALLVAPVKVPAVESLRAIIDPGPETYIIDETLLK